MHKPCRPGLSGPGAHWSLCLEVLEACFVKPGDEEEGSPPLVTEWTSDRIAGTTAPGRESRVLHCQGPPDQVPVTGPRVRARVLCLRGSPEAVVGRPPQAPVSVLRSERWLPGNKTNPMSQAPLGGDHAPGARPREASSGSDPQEEDV